MYKERNKKMDKAPRNFHFHLATLIFQKSKNENMKQWGNPHSKANYRHTDIDRRNISRAPMIIPKTGQLTSCMVSKQLRKVIQTCFFVKK